MSPRTPATNQAMRDASRRAILDAAVHVFGEVGPHQATTAAIAARAGVAKGLVFVYFPSKETLLEAVVESRLSEALHYWRDLPPLRGAALLMHIVNRALDRAIEHPQEMRLYLALFFEPGAAAAVRKVEARMKPDVEAYYRVLATALAEAGAAQPAIDAALLQAAINGLVQNLVIQPDLARRPSEFPRAQFVERLVHAFTSPRRVRAAKAKAR